MLIQPHCLCLTTSGLSGHYEGPAVVIDMPASVNERKGSSRIGKIGPGGHSGSIAVPGAGFFEGAILNGINRSIAIILKFITIEVAGNIRSILGKTGHRPLTAGHGLDYKVFLLILNGFFA